MSLPQTINPAEVRDKLKWSQAQMASYLRCNQSSVSRMEANGKVSRLFHREYEELVTRIADGEAVAAPDAEAA